MNLLMGLLKPTKGELLVEGEPVRGGRLRLLRSCIAHVPQSSFLTDASIADNIAFGVPTMQINRQQVKRAAE